MTKASTGQTCRATFRLLGRNSSTTSPRLVTCRIIRKARIDGQLKKMTNGDLMDDLPSAWHMTNAAIPPIACRPDTKQQRSIAYLGGTMYSREGYSSNSFSVLSINKAKMTIIQTPFMFVKDTIIEYKKNLCNLFSNEGEPSRLKYYRKEGEIRNPEDGTRNILLNADTFSNILMLFEVHALPGSN